MNGKLSVVIPVYNEENISICVETLINVLCDAKIPHEIILVDDGSSSSCKDEIFSLVKQYSNIVCIELSRNFGKENALCAGLDMASGDCCVCMDADMQHPPEVIPKMYDLWRNNGYEVIEGVKTTRGKENTIYRLCTKVFYSAFKKTAHIDLKNASDFRLLDRAAISAWKSMPEKQTFFRGMSSWIGFRRTQVCFDVGERAGGNSKWHISKLIGLAVDAVTSYSAAPLYISAFFGFWFLIFFTGMFIQTICMKAMGYAQSGFSTIIVLQLIIGSILMISVGIIGVYVEKIYNEVKARPRYLVRRVIKNSSEDGNEDFK
ncbi:MAG: glycosyltransferase family 2 protein [Clostridia bacterium]|nr:glycosyltransferase family 2 protein [Clostridia bacterium]